MRVVLVVDDSATVREMLIAELQRCGFNAIAVADGAEAIEKMQTILPALVITDLVMPRVNGYELCRNIKGDPRTQHVPVIMCSTKAEEFDRYWGMKQGADAYITKPFQPRDLINAVKYLLEETGFHSEDTTGAVTK
jgi:twitching motility two-component system response regulator PilH